MNTFWIITTIIIIVIVAIVAYFIGTCSDRPIDSDDYARHVSWRPGDEDEEEEEEEEDNAENKENL